MTNNKIKSESPAPLMNKDIPRLIKGLTMLLPCGIPEFKISYTIDRNIDKLVSMNRSHTSFLYKLLKKHKGIFEGDNPKVEDGNYVFESTEFEKSFILDRDKLDNSSLPDKLWIIKASKLDGAVNVPPAALRLLAGLIENDIILSN